MSLSCINYYGFTLTFQFEMFSCCISKFVTCHTQSGQIVRRQKLQNLFNYILDRTICPMFDRKNILSIVWPYNRRCLESIFFFCTLCRHWFVLDIAEFNGLGFHYFSQFDCYNLCNKIQKKIRFKINEIQN